MADPDYFSIICDEICTKQNGIELKTGDDRFLRELFDKRGGNVRRLTQGVLSEFDRLKVVISDAYQAGRIASQRPRLPKISVDVTTIQEQLNIGRTAALRMAEIALGQSLLKALLNKDSE